MIVTLDQVKEWLGVDVLTEDQETALWALVGRAQAAIERELDWYFDVPRAAIEILDGNGRDRIYLRQPPVLTNNHTITIETRYGVGDTEWEVLDVSYWEQAGRALFCTGTWPCGRRTIRVTYWEGFDTPPGEIVQLLLNLVSSKVLLDDSGELASETIGDYSYTRKDLQEQVDIWPTIVNDWKRGRI